MISKRKITVANPESDTTSIPVSLHRGEKEALRLSIQLGRCLLATDNGKAIKAARFLGVPFVITPKIVVELHRLKRVPLKKAREALEN
jgi:predicted nucleic acid-binding protein